MRQPSIAALGRVLLALLFLASGLSKLGAAGATKAYIASVGLPLPSVIYAIALVAEIGGGLLLLLGFQARITATLLAVFTVMAATLFHHDFADQNQTVHFLKNLAIAGGLLQVSVAGATRFSLDARRPQKA